MISNVSARNVCSKRRTTHLNSLFLMFFNMPTTRSWKTHVFLKGSSGFLFIRYSVTIDQSMRLGSTQLSLKFRDYGIFRLKSYHRHHRLEIVVFETSLHFNECSLNLASRYLALTPSKDRTFSKFWIYLDLHLQPMYPKSLIINVNISMEFDHPDHKIHPKSDIYVSDMCLTFLRSWKICLLPMRQQIMYGTGAAYALLSRARSIPNWSPKIRTRKFSGIAASY